MKAFSPGVIILAAGSSRRMGRPKLLLPWGTTSVLGHLIESWQEAGTRQIGVVCSKQIQAIHDELDRLRFPKENKIANPDPDRGMFSSIQCAAAWLDWSRELTHWAIVLGDQPHLRAETVRQLLHFSAEHPEKICQPLRNGRRRHPVLLPQSFFTSLVNTSAVDLKAFLQLHAGHLDGFESTDAGLDFDMDTPEDYERARALFL